MKKIVYILVILGIALSIFFVFFYKNKTYVDFDKSLQKIAYPELFKVPWNMHTYSIFSKLYQKNNLLRVQDSRKYKIPKKLHQIWLGSSFPEKYKAFQQSWIKNHPDWEYYLWTEETLAAVPMRNKDLYKAARNYGEKSDIARYEILYLYGGLYIDTDFECLKPFDIFNRCYDFYIGIQPLDTNSVQLGIGLIGARPGSELLNTIIEGLQTNKHIMQIIAKTGPIYASRIFCDTALTCSECVCAFPPTFFYPRGYTQSFENRTTWLKPESYAIHHWEGSWLLPTAWEKS